MKQQVVLGSKNQIVFSKDGICGYFVYLKGKWYGDFLHGILSLSELEQIVEKVKIGVKNKNGK